MVDGKKMILAFLFVCLFFPALIILSLCPFCKCSSSDIIRDLLEEEEAWEASHRNDQNREINPEQNHRTRATESAETEPRNKRNRN